MLNKYLFSAVLLTISYEKLAQQEILLKPGRYMGMEYMGEEDITPYDKTDKWYHENTLLVKGNALLLKRVPVVIYKGEHHYRYSASDGGFYSYLGEVYKEKNLLIARMQLIKCEYCGTPTAEDSTHYFSVKIQPESIVLNNVIYKRY